MLQTIKKWIQYTITNTQPRLVLFLTLSVFFIIVAVSFTSYYTSKSVLQEELSEPQQQLLRIGMNYIDESFKESNNVAIKLALHSNIYEFLVDENQNSYKNISEIYQLFTTLIKNTAYIKSIYIYDLERSSFVAIPQGYHSNKITFVDSEWVGVANEFGENMMVVKKRDVPEGTNGFGSEITLFRKIMIQNQFKGIIAINMKHEEIFSQLKSPSKSNVDHMRMIMDQQGEILYSTSNFPFDPEKIQRATIELSEKRLGDVKYQDKQLLASQIESDLTGWRYISIISQDSLLAKTKKIRNVVFSVSVISLLFGVVTIFYLNAVAFRPVRRMKQLFSVKTVELHSPDLIHLEKLTGELMSDHAQLSQLIRETMSEASSKFLYDLYLGNIHNLREVREKWNNYFKGWTNDPLWVAIISIDHFEDWSRKFPSNDHSLLKFALGNIIAEILAAHWRSEFVDLGNDKLGVLLQTTGENQPLNGKFLESIEVISRLLKFSISVGISTSQHNIEKIQKAMFEANNALSYRLYRGYGSVVSFQEVSEHEMPEILTRDTILYELTEAIEAGDTSRSQYLSGSIVEEIRGNEWYPSKALSFLKKIKERIHRIGLGDKNEIWVDQKLFDHLNTMNLDDIAELLNRQVVELSERFGQLIQSKDFITCQQMIEYMKLNLGEPIGIQEIVDSIGISVSLGSQVFKHEMNETIYGYFTKLRMQRASELLLGTDENISSIAIRVGYQHENSFIRVFRKFNDITPGKYREMMKHKKDTLME